MPSCPSLFQPVLVLWFISQAQTTLATEACCCCSLASMCYFTYPAQSAGSCYCLFIQLLLCIGPGTTVGNKITHCHANQRQFISVIGKAPANSSRYRSSCCLEALGNWGDAERAKKMDLAQIGDAIATQNFCGKNNGCLMCNCA